MTDKMHAMSEIEYEDTVKKQIEQERESYGQREFLPIRFSGLQKRVLCSSTIAKPDLYNYEIVPGR